MLEPATVLGVHRLSADVIEWALEAPASLACFPEHFPGQPLLPGVVQLGWAIDACQKEFGLERLPCKLSALKFQHPIRPGTQLRLRIERHATQFSFSYRDDRREYSCGKLGFADAG